MWHLQCPTFYAWSHLPCIPQPSSIFDKSWGPTLLQYGITNPKGNHFYAYSSFIGMNFNKDAKVWTYFPNVLDPFVWHKFKFFCPSFKFWLCGVNLLFNLALNAFQGKIIIQLNILMHHPPFQRMISQERLCHSKLINMDVDHLGLKVGLHPEGPLFHFLCLNVLSCERFRCWGFHGLCGFFA